MKSISRNDHFGDRAILALPPTYQEYLVTLTLMMSLVVQRARPLKTLQIHPNEQYMFMYYEKALINTSICNLLYLKTVFFGAPVNQLMLPVDSILENPGATSRDDAIFSGERYFQAKVYFKSWRAPGNLLLLNQFQKRSNSVPLIGQKNIFLANMRGVLAG